MERSNCPLAGIVFLASWLACVTPGEVSAQAPPPAPPTRDESFSDSRMQECEAFLLEFARSQNLPHAHTYVRTNVAPGHVRFGNLPDVMGSSDCFAGEFVLMPLWGNTDYDWIWKSQRATSTTVNGRPARVASDHATLAILALTINDQRFQFPRIGRIRASRCIIWHHQGWKVAVTLEQSSPEAGGNVGELRDACLAEATRLAELLDHALDGIPDSPPAGDLELVDANPFYLLRDEPRRTPEDQPELPFSGTPSARDLQILATSGVKRIGAVTDGVSLLLLRVRLPGDGSLSFSLEGSDELGSLHPLQGSPFADGEALDALTVPATKVSLQSGDDRPAFFGFALYRPPLTSWTGAAARSVQVKASFEPTSGTELAFQAPLTLVRPPVVLVHGTYDNPLNCWRNGFLTTQGRQLRTMHSRLVEGEGLKVFMVDWEATNGSKDPSAFTDNERSVFVNPGGIQTAVYAMRQDGFACTQADLVCHSQGGAIARVFIKGLRSDSPRHPSDPHTTAPERCENCWYHNDENFPTFRRGSVRRLITLCTTHQGSDICRIFTAYQLAAADNLLSPVAAPAAYWTYLFQAFAGSSSGVYTGGFRDQVPFSAGLRAIGRTPVASHAIACVADDDDLETVVDDAKLNTEIEPGKTKVSLATLVPNAERAAAPGKWPKGYYQDRLETIWHGSLEKTIEDSFRYLGQTADMEELLRLKLKYARTWPTEDELQRVLRECTSALRRAVFVRNPGTLPPGYERNDCTVSQVSAHGGLAGSAVTTLEHMLHGFAPRYPAAQDRVAALLTDSRKSDDPLCPFAREGFPDSYAGLTEMDPRPPAPQNPSGAGTVPGSTPPSGGRTVPPIGTPLASRVTPTEAPGLSGVDIGPAGLALADTGGELTVTGVQGGGPADTAGVKVGDVLLAVNGKRTQGLSAAQVGALMLAAPAAPVRLTLGRGEDLLPVELTPVPEVGDEGDEAEAGDEGDEAEEGAPAPASALESPGFVLSSWSPTLTGQAEGAEVLDDSGELIMNVPAGVASTLEIWSKGTLTGGFSQQISHRVEEFEASAGDTLSVEIRFATAPNLEASAVVIRREVDADGNGRVTATAGESENTVLASGRNVDITVNRTGRDWSVMKNDQKSYDSLGLFFQDMPDEVYVGLVVRKKGAAALSLNLARRAAAKLTITR